MTNKRTYPKELFEKVLNSTPMDEFSKDILCLIRNLKVIKINFTLDKISCENHYYSNIRYGYPFSILSFSVINKKDNYQRGANRFIHKFLEEFHIMDVIAKKTTSENEYNDKQIDFELYLTQDSNPKFLPLDRGKTGQDILDEIKKELEILNDDSNISCENKEKENT